MFIDSILKKSEPLIIVLICYGYFILGSILNFFFPQNTPAITNNSLSFLLIYEPIALGIVLVILRKKRWNYVDFNIQPTFYMTGVGIILAFASYYSYYLLYIISSAIIPSFYEISKQTVLVGENLNFGLVLLVSLINPIFEELIVVGYLIPVLEKMKSLTFAINVSVMIRLLYHLYQGPVGVVSIVPMGLLFAYWYAYKRNLWPLLIAHFIEDLLGLVYFT
jgi:uncharacterized protein